MLRHIVERSKKVPVVGLESIGNYTNVYFEDGKRVLSAYTSKIVRNKLDTEFLIVRRGVYVNPDFVKQECDFVKLGDTLFKISRRNLTKWVAILAIALIWCVSPSDSRGQNTAPVAVNDTLLVCNDLPTYFSVVANDYDTNGDRLRLSSFIKPASGDLVAASNTGQFRFDWSYALSDTISFSYHIKELKFGGLNSLESNSATVTLYSAAPYFYSGTYTGTNTRLTCRSENNSSTTINTTARETNEAYQYILMDANYGTVTIAPGTNGVVQFKIKD